MTKPDSIRYPSARRHLIALAVVLVALLVAVTVHAQEPAAHRAGLIVEYGDGNAEQFCLDFEADSVTGTYLLEQSGLEAWLDSGSMGSRLCRIGEVGCEPGREPCFCQCQGINCRYWNYFLWQEGRWTYSPVGPNLRDVHDGDVDAWVWGDGKTAPSTPAESLCLPSFEAPAPATASPAPSASAETPAPAVTPATAVAEATVSPASAPSASATEALSAPAVGVNIPCPSLGLILPALLLTGFLMVIRTR